MGPNPMQSRPIIQKFHHAFAISRDFAASKFEFNGRIAILENTYLVKCGRCMKNWIRIQNFFGLIVRLYTGVLY